MELGHQGTRKTYLRITDSCYWPGMFKDVEKFVSMCKECQLNKQPTSKPAGVPHILPVPERPWQSIAKDFVGPLTESQGFKNILVIMDRFSGFLLCFPLPEKYSAIHPADTFCHGVGRDINVQCLLIKEMIIIVDHYTLAVRNRR
jgi:hypothetical protein